MSAGNYIGYFSHLIEQGKMTEEEASKKLEELHKIDMMHDEFDREFFKNCKAYIHSGSVLTKEQTEEYVNTSWDLLVLLANKSIKGYSSEQMALLIGVSLDKYKHLEMGYYNFTNELSYDTISEKLEFNKEEFYFTFNKSFKYIEGGAN